MFTLYSNGFGKAAADLNKKEFQDKKALNKIIAKAKCTDGVQFEGSVIPNKGAGPQTQGTADIKVVIPFDKDFKIETKFEADGNCIVTPKFSVDGANFGFDAKGLRYGKWPESLIGMFEYQTKDYAFDGKVGVKDGKVASAAAILSAALPASFICHNLNIGGSFGVAQGDKGMVQEFAASYGTKEYDIAFKLNTSISGGTSMTFGNATVLFSMNASDNLTIAASASSGSTRESINTLWATCEEQDGTQIELTANYQITCSQTSKSKFTYNDKSIRADFVIITKLAGNSSLATSLAFSGGKWRAPPCFGLCYTLDQ